MVDDELGQLRRGARADGWGWSHLDWPLLVLVGLLVRLIQERVSSSSIVWLHPSRLLDRASSEGRVRGTRAELGWELEGSPAAGTTQPPAVGLGHSPGSSPPPPPRLAAAASSGRHSLSLSCHERHPPSRSCPP